MRVVRISEIPEERVDRATPVPGWTGGPLTRSRQEILPAGSSKFFNCGVRSFGRGATTGFHTHSSDQILVITAGVGMVATEHEEHQVTVGDIIFTPAGQPHCHGATKSSYMSHISITSFVLSCVRPAGFQNIASELSTAAT